MKDGLQNDYLKIAEKLLLEKYTPAAVIINDQLDIIHIHGIVAPYLHPSPGKPTFNLLKMANKGIAFELRNAIHKAKQDNKTIVKRGILLKENTLNEHADLSNTRSFTIEVVPLTNTVESYYLVLFSKAPKPGRKGEKSAGTLKTDHQKAEKRIAQLEKELAQTREDMRSITEEQEAANEELQSANEELQSSTEELQSLNEELVTSEEELLSSNEELMAVNQELIEKQEQLNAALLFAESIVSTIREPLIVLDDRLRVKTANHSFYRKFLLTGPDTEGKLFFELQSGAWNDEELLDSLQKIIRNKMRIIDYEIELDFPLIGKRIIQLNAKRVVENERKKNTELLILLALEDITEKKKNERLVAETKTRNMAEMTRQMIWTATAEGKINYVNNFTCDYTGYDADYLRENALIKLLHPADLAKVTKKLNELINAGEGFKLETRIINSKRAYCWHLCQAYPEKNARGNITGWVFSHTEIQDQKTREQEKDQLITAASRELKTALTSLKGYALQVHENIADTNHKKALNSSSRLMNHVDELLVKDILEVKKA